MDGVDLMGGNRDDCSRPWEVEDFCDDPIGDEAQGGQVKGQR